MYSHEAKERKPNTHPMCTELPACSIDYTRMKQYLQDRHLNYELALANGWFPSNEASDAFPRVVIPATTHKAGHVYWQARDTTGKAYLRYQTPKGPRHEALIKVYPEVPPRGIVIVEGPLDALAVAGAGCIGYALMGMQPSIGTLHHLALLVEDNNDLDVMVVLDRDSAQHAIKIATFLSSQGYFTQIQSLPGPEKDLAECLPAKRKNFLKTHFLKLRYSNSSQ
jgi:hypothetical protein